MKKILFISHDACRAGAQLFLLELLIKFKCQSIFNFEILLSNSGELLPEFEKLAPTRIWHKPFNNNTIVKYCYLLKANFRKKRILKYYKKQKFDLIYSNTITNGSLLHELAALNIPVITHVHELNYWIEKCGAQNLRYIKEYTKRYICVSEAVKNNLIEKYCISKDRIELIHEFIDFEKINHNQERNGLRKWFNISDSSIIVGASGAEGWRKGKDLFIPLAIQVLSATDNDIHFIWIGGELNYELNYDIKKSEFHSQIHFIDHLSNANRYFNDFDIFLMLSREDPFPIVNLEVAALGKPILCFDNTGGPPELLNEVKECISPYLDLRSMAENIIKLVNNKEKRQFIGKFLQEKTKKYYDISTIVEKVMSTVNQTI
ncbi:MAG TPA: glycosyltransferase family 4 protein [Bacteroidales bacterium]|nr:glycosyltransferase family 4 protein [Bacteroidales bacterium]